MEKILIYNISVKTKLEKTLFQIFLPENTEAINGIVVTCDLNKLSDDTEIADVGIIRLHVPDTGDKFFAQVLQQFTSIPSFQIIGLIETDLIGVVTPKKHFEFFETYQPTENTLIEGYYEDFAGQKFSGTFGYNVRVYMRLKMKQP